jgi:hypothetical protein
MRALPCLVVAFITATGCNNSGNPVLFILPDGFRGEIQIIKDSVKGAEPAERGDWWVFEVPPSGVLRIKDDRMFYRWHAQRAQYSDGRAVSVELVGTRAGFSAGSGDYSTEYDGTTHTWRVR